MCVGDPEFDVALGILLNYIPTKNKGGAQRKKDPKRANNKNKNNQVARAPVASNRSSGKSQIMRYRVRESERFGSVASPGVVAYTVVNSVPFNPGLAASLPWLSGVATHYDRYMVHYLKYTYKNLVGTSTSGNIIMSFDHDARDSPPDSAITQSQSTTWVDGAPWRIFTLTVKPNKELRYVRGGPVTYTDIKSYDFGNLYVATEGVPNGTMGYLEVEYDIEFFDKSSNRPDAGIPNSTASTISISNPSSVSGGTSNSSVPWDTFEFDGIGGFLQTTNSFVCTKTGYYQFDVVLEVTFSGASVTSCALNLRVGNTIVRTCGGNTIVGTTTLLTLSEVRFLAVGDTMSTTIGNGGGVTWSIVQGSGGYFKFTQLA